MASPLRTRCGKRRLATNPVSAKVNTWTLTQVVFCAFRKAPMYGSTAK